MTEREDAGRPAGRSLVLPAEPASAARAREFVRALLRSSRHAGLEDAALLCVTELIANAALHTGSHRCVVTVVDEPDDVIIEVADEAPEPPVLQPSPGISEHGRGLFIVDALAGEWGVRPVPERGKSVWLRLCDA